jgi:hypothetical protein
MVPVVGAVGGAAVQRTRRESVAETAIMFHLDKPITLQAAQ